MVAEQDGDLVGFCAWVHLPHLPPTKVEGLGTYVVPRHGATMRRAFPEVRRGARGASRLPLRGRDRRLRKPGRSESVLRRGFRVVGVHAS